MPTLLKIARMGHPVLRVKAEPIADPTAPDVARLARDMIATMDDADGVGLAAPQIHVSQRIIVFKAPVRGPDMSRDGDVDNRVLINPEIEPLSPDRASAFEGCLSIPGLRGVVPRFTRIRYSGVGLDGRRISVEAEGFHARVLQHEVDHLDGVLYLDRMENLALLSFEKELPLLMGAIDSDRA